MKRFLMAMQFLTRVPMPSVQGNAADFAASMRWFPAVGLLIGAAITGAAWLGLLIDSWTGALAALSIWVLLTGALHLDGLGDLMDGCGAAHGDRSRIQAVMADPHVGSFGVVAIALQLIAKLVLLHALLIDVPLWWLIPIPFAARIGPLVWTRWLPPLHAGLGARFIGAIRIVDVLGWGAVLLGAAVVAPGLQATLLLIPIFGLWLRHAIGGISGDGHGAGIELIETGLLLAAVIAGSF